MDELDKLLECTDIEIALLEVLTELTEIEKRSISEVSSFTFPDCPEQGL